MKSLQTIVLTTALALSLPATPVSAQSTEIAGAEAASALSWLVPLVIIGAIVAASKKEQATQTVPNLGNVATAQSTPK